MITKLYSSRIKKSLLQIAVFSLITVVVWLAMSTYRTLAKPQVPPDVKKQITPLTASLELDTIDQINERLETPAVDWSSVGQLMATPAANLSVNKVAEASPSGETNNEVNSQ